MYGDRPLAFASLSYEVNTLWDPAGEPTENEPEQWQPPIEIMGVAHAHQGDDRPVARIHALLFPDWISGVDRESESSDTVPLWVDRLIDENQGGPIRAVLDALDAEPSVLLKGDLLTIHRVEVIPEYQGIGLGQVMIDELARTIARRASWIALHASPLQFELVSGDIVYSPWGPDWYARMGLTPGKAESFDEDQKRLVGHYARSGFTEVPGQKGLMVRINNASRTGATQAAGQTRQPG